MKSQPQNSNFDSGLTYFSLRYVDTGAIAGALLSKAILFKLAEGDTVEDVINDVEEMITALVKHVAGED